MMKKLLTITMMFFSLTTWAELPSWGMTENQYKLPNFNSKMKEIGEQAASKNWLLKITAPKDWHNKIRMGLTDSGAKNVQVNFKDSLHQSITITAAPGLKMAKVAPSSSSNTTVQKQVVIDKPEIDTEVEAPDFEKIEIESNTAELMESINNIEIAIPQSNSSKATESVKEDNKAVAKEPSPAPVKTQPQPQTPVSVAQPTEAQSNEADIEAIKESLRKRYARTKRVEKVLSYENIRSKDDLFIQGPVVLVKRFINQGVALYFWMKEDYDPGIHKLVEKGSGKYSKDPSAEKGEVPEAKKTKEFTEEVKVTDLDFIAIDTDIDTQDELRKDFARNKRVTVNIRANQLKKDDVLYVMNDTVLVERPITSAQSAYFWLVGDTAIPREVEQKDEQRFIVR